MPFPAAFYPSQSCPPILQQLEKKQIVKKIALEALVELAVSLSLAFLLTHAFSLTGPYFFTAALVQLAVNTVLRLGRIYCHLQNHETLANLFSWTEASSFSLLLGIHWQTFLHESGHALAARAIFKQANPRLYFYPFGLFGGAHTRYRSQELSWLGAKLGKEKAQALISFCGPALSLTISTILLALAIAHREKYPKLSNYLIAAATLDFLFHAHYAFSALFWPRTDCSHDFVRLASAGLHPLIALIAIVAIPILIVWPEKIIGQKKI